MAAGAELDAQSSAKRLRRSTGVIRSYRPADREAVRDICRKTAYRNLGSSSVFEDGEAFADYWTGYYTDHEPESCLVVEEDGRVVGYLLGCIDSSRFMRVMSRSILPRLLKRMLGRLITCRYKQKATRRAIYWFLLHSWRENPGVPIERFPAHYHCNVLRQGYGKAYYTSMAIAFVERLQELGVGAIHGQVLEAADGGPWQRMADSYPGMWRPGYHAETPSSFYRIVLGDRTKMVNRAWGASTEAYREWMIFLGAKYRL